MEIQTRTEMKVRRVERVHPDADWSLAYGNDGDEGAELHTVYERNAAGVVVEDVRCGSCDALWPCSCLKPAEVREPRVKTPGACPEVTVEVVLMDHSNSGFYEAVLRVDRDEDTAAALERVAATLEAAGAKDDAELVRRAAQPTVVSGGWNNRLRTALAPLFSVGRQSPDDGAGATGAPTESPL